jgi:ferredoxin-type protein NapH
VIQFLLLTKSITLPILIAGLIPLILAFFLGKVFCSWVCPFNLLAEWGEQLRKKFKKQRKITKNHNPKTFIYWIIYSSIIIAIPILGMALINFISMPGLISSSVADWIISSALGVEILFIVGILFIEFLLGKRFWCKYVCPVGATLELPRNKNTLKIHFNPQHKCVCDSHDPACNIKCPIHLDPRRPDIHPYCYNCGECIHICHRVGGENLIFSLQSPESSSAKKKHKFNMEAQQ